MAIMYKCPLANSFTWKSHSKEIHDEVLLIKLPFSLLEKEASFELMLSSLHIKYNKHSMIYLIRAYTWLCWHWTKVKSLSCRYITFLKQGHRNKVNYNIQPRMPTSM